MNPEEEQIALKEYANAKKERDAQYKQSSYFSIKKQKKKMKNEIWLDDQTKIVNFFQEFTVIDKSRKIVPIEF